MRSRAIALTVAALVSIPIVASTAAAEPVEMYAPYARAAARVHSPGTLLAAKNISEVTHPETGTYCLKVSDPDIDDLANAAIHVTAINGGASITVRAYGSGADDCLGSEFFRVNSVYSDNHKPVDVSFTVSVL